MRLKILILILMTRVQKTGNYCWLQLSLSYAEIVQKISEHWGWQDMQEQELKDLVHWRHPSVEYQSTCCPIFMSANSSSMSLPTLLLYFRRSSVGLQVYLWVDRVSTDMSTNRVGRYDNSSTYWSTGQRHAWLTLLLGLHFLYFLRVFRVWLVSLWSVWQFLTNSRENACYRG